MPHRSLASLAHALGGVTDLDAAVRALAWAVGEIDPAARVACLDLDSRSGLLSRLRTADDGDVHSTPCDVAFDHLPTSVVDHLRAGRGFVDLGDEAPAYARLVGIGELAAGGRVLLRGLHFEGQLVGVLALIEPRAAFEVSLRELAEPLASVFELAVARCAEREARSEAVRTLEDTTRRVHAEYVARLAGLEREMGVRGTVAAATLERERSAARQAEEARRTAQRQRALEQQVAAAVAQLEQAHIELHRRSDALRQRTRTLYLIERVLTLAAAVQEPARLAEGLLGLVGDDMQAMRCSLLLTTPDDPTRLFLAAARGLAPHVRPGSTIRVGEGIAGRVAQTREPLLVVDSEDAVTQPLLGDEYLTTGSFICFPLIAHDALLGVVNLTNRAQRGLFVEEDVERVRLLALVIAIVAAQADLARRLAPPRDAR